MLDPHLSGNRGTWSFGTLSNMLHCLRSILTQDILSSLPGCLVHVYLIVFFFSDICVILGTLNQIEVGFIDDIF